MQTSTSDRLRYCHFSIARNKSPFQLVALHCFPRQEKSVPDSCAIAGRQVWSYFEQPEQPSFVNGTVRGQRRFTGRIGKWLRRAAGNPLRAMINGRWIGASVTTASVTVYSLSQECYRGRSGKLMKFRNGLMPQPYERRLQELRWERKAENARVERLSAILAKKSAAKPARLPDRAA